MPGRMDGASVLVGRGGGSIHVMDGTHKNDTLICCCARGVGTGTPATIVLAQMNHRGVHPMPPLVTRSRPCV